MPIKEVTNSQLLKEIRELKGVVSKNGSEVESNRSSIEMNRVSIVGNGIEIRKNGKMIEELFKMYFSIEKKITSIEKSLELFPEFYNKVDKLVGEIIESRAEKALMLARVENHEKRITTLESR